MVLWPGCESRSRCSLDKRTCDRCSSLWKGGDVVWISRLPLRWMCDSPRTGCARRTTPIYKWREQAILEWFRRVISIAACCHSVKFYALPARAFRSQQCHCSKESVDSKSGVHNMRPARTFSMIRNVAKARRRISNCRSIISSILQRNFYSEMK